eukprot:21751_1
MGCICAPDLPDTNKTDKGVNDNEKNDEPNALTPDIPSKHCRITANLDLVDDLVITEYPTVTPYATTHIPNKEITKIYSMSHTAHSISENPISDSDKSPTNVVIIATETQEEAIVTPKTPFLQSKNINMDSAYKMTVISSR